MSRGLFDTLEDIYMIAAIGVEGLLKSTGASDSESLVQLRDGIIQRLIYLAPDTQEEEDDDEDSSTEEAIRLAGLLLAMDRLFSPVLPSAYFQITHMVADRLASLINRESLAVEWADQERIMLWICFIGTSVSSNNPRTRNVFVHAAVLMCMQLFNGPKSLANELEETLGGVMGTAELFEEAELGPFMADLHTGCVDMSQ